MQFDCQFLSACAAPVSQIISLSTWSLIARIWPISSLASLVCGQSAVYNRYHRPDLP